MRTRALARVFFVSEQHAKQYFFSRRRLDTLHN